MGVNDFVMPAKAGIQCDASASRKAFCRADVRLLDSRLRGNDTIEKGALEWE